MGTEANPSSDRDTGAATWVGGDMFVGKRPANSTENNSTTNNLMNATGPYGSYAVEAEGLTVVNGKLLLNPLKNSWSDKVSGGAFRFGIAGFGSQFRPANGSTALVVGGNSNTMIDAGASTTAKVKAWSRPGFIMGYNHQGSIAGTDTGVWGGASTGALKTVGEASLQWNDGDLSKVSVKTEDNGTATEKDLSEDTFYQDYVVEDISAPLATQTATGETTISEADTTTVTRHHYISNTSKISYDFKYSDETKYGTGKGIATNESYKNREKLITFTGTNNPSMEVFTVNASDLSDTWKGTRYRGVAFAFNNIADTASVVVNVKDDQNDVTFHTGWKFYWNGTEISDGYSDAATNEVKAAYAKAAQKILWNFHDTDNLTIYGGVANEDTNGKVTEDDPSAAMLGSIIVIGNASSGNNGADPLNTTGNFESHVSTNGRVYTEGDFSMYNPYKAWNWNQPGAKEGDSASVIDMDQERHNFPWNGSYTESCSAIAWNKSDENGTALAGTTWAVYGKYDDAVNGQNALYTAVKDNDFADKDQAAGAFKIEGLKPNARYFIKEVATGDSDYQLNTNIYYAATGDASDTAVKVTQSVTKDASGNLVFGDADIYTDQTDNTKKSIINKSAGHEVAWKKTAEGDSTYKPLAGSAWQIAAKDSSDKTKVWNVEDNVNAATGVTVTSTSTELNATNSYKATLTAKVDPTEAMQHVTWTFTEASGNPKTDETAAVLSQTDNLRADVIGTSDKDATVYVKACSVSNPDVCSSVVTITVKAANVTSFTVKDSGNNDVQNNASFTVAQNGSLDFTAAVTPSVPIAWSTSNESVATVSTQSNGAKATVTMHGLGSAVITAKAGNKTVSFTVSTPSTTVYFKKTLVNWSNYYLYYDNGTEWTFAKMNRTCGDYVAVTIPQATSGKGFVFHDSTDKNSGNWYKPDTTATSNFKFTGNAVQVVELYNNSTGSTVPTACVASTTADTAAAYDGTVSAQSDESADGSSVESADADAGDVSAQTDVSGADGLAADESVADDAVESDAVADAVANDVSADGRSDVLTVADESKAASCTAKDGTVGADNKVTPGMKCDIDTVAGQFKVDGLNAGTYLLHEITAPDGYTLNKTVYQFTIGDDGNVTWDGGWPSEADVSDQSKFKTDLKPGTGNAIGDTPTEITWYKVSSEDKNPTADTYLKGAQWKLTFTPAPGSTDSAATYCVVDGNGDIATKSDNTPTCDGKKLTDVSNTDQQSGDVKNEADGIIKLTGLKFGSYELVETVAPDGYDLSTTKYTFTIDQDPTDGTVQIYRPATSTAAVQSDADGPGDVSVSDSGIVPMSGEPTEKVQDNKIPNKPGVELPATGGEGTSVFLRSGVIAVLVATFGLAFMARRRRS
ncbi:SpaA isopeptide-forming pilin-related protein, partial [Bifidobacterium biavatii]